MENLDLTFSALSHSTRRAILEKLMHGEERLSDLAEPFDFEERILVTTGPISGTWFEDVYPGASFTLRLSRRSPHLGVFEETEDALLLRGVVSPLDGVTRTELTFSPAVPVLRFPLDVTRG